MNHIIIQVRAEQVTALQVISTKTFLETFAHLNTPENMSYYIASAFNEEQLTSELNNNNSLFYFIYMNQDLAGYLKLNARDAQTEKHDDTALEIERIYILRQYHGKSMGKALLDRAIETAKQMNKKYIWLGVWEKNKKAIQFYEKNGFTLFGKHMFKLGNDVQMDYLFKRMLK